MATHHDHDDFGGLHRDLFATGAAVDRRGLFRIAAQLGAVTLFGCGSTTAPTAAGNTTNPTNPTTPGTGGGACSRVPEETAGPFPSDGSNGPTVLSATGVVRSDIRGSFAGLSGTADGVPLGVEL